MHQFKGNYSNPSALETWFLHFPFVKLIELNGREKYAVNKVKHIKSRW